MGSSSCHVRSHMHSITARRKARLIRAVGSALPNRSYILDLIHHFRLNAIRQMGLRILAESTLLRTRSYAQCISAYGFLKRRGWYGLVGRQHRRPTRPVHTALSYDAPMPPGSHMTVLNIKLYLFARSLRSHHRSRSSTNPETSSPVLFWRLVQATEHGHGELQLQRHLHAR
jgi:hypothetical protein